MRLLAVLGSIATLASCGMHPAGAPPAPASSASEYAVYRFIVARELAYSQPVLLEDSVWPTPRTPWLPDAPLQDSSLAQSFIEANAAGLLLQRDSLTDTSVVLVSGSDFKMYGLPGTIRRHPGAMGLIDLSRVGFNHDSTLAAVRVYWMGESSGHPRYYLLVRRRGRPWTLKACVEPEGMVGARRLTGACSGGHGLLTPE